MAMNSMKLTTWTNIRGQVSNIVKWIDDIAKIAILENGGRMEMRDSEPTYIINCDF